MKKYKNEWDIRKLSNAEVKGVLKTFSMGNHHVEELLNVFYEMGVTPIYPVKKSGFNIGFALDHTNLEAYNTIKNVLKLYRAYDHCSIMIATDGIDETPVGECYTVPVCRLTINEERDRDKIAKYIERNIDKDYYGDMMIEKIFTLMRTLKGKESCLKFVITRNEYSYNFTIETAEPYGDSELYNYFKKLFKENKVENYRGCSCFAYGKEGMTYKELFEYMDYLNRVFGKMELPLASEVKKSMCKIRKKRVELRLGTI